MLRSVRLLAADLAQGKTSSRELTEACLDRIGREGGEGPRAFTRTYAESARAAADAADRLRAAGVVLSPIAGLPVSVKDLFDVAGEPTLAGSTVLRDAPPAAADAEVVARLRRAGAVVVGKTNMTEFAFSGLGMNPHYGSPRAPWDRAAGRISGGSSSGAAVSVADEMAAFAIGTDTGGSVRIPAAFCGLVGFKPTARRVPLAGAFPLSRSLDSIGPIATTVACCATIDRVLSGDRDGESGGSHDPGHDASRALPIAGLRLGVPCQYVLDDLDPEVARAFAAALSVLSAAGARVVDLDVPALLELPDIHKGGGFAAPEAYAVHRKLIEERESAYDPRVASRILRGRTASAADYVDLVDRRVAFQRSVERAAAPFDALVLPAVALAPPRLADLEASDDAYYRANARALRNTTVINFLDGCALSIPCHEPGTAPVGLMVAGVAGSDLRILAVGRAIESALAAR
jgi:aspartyl-tRNA(Asn)/glutamyl-tRNA(Gln) amidotransferase subunit A